MMTVIFCNHNDNNSCGDKNRKVVLFQGYKIKKMEDINRRWDMILITYQV